MKRLKMILLVVALTFFFQLVADHIMRSIMRGASFLFVASLAGACGLFALLLVKRFYRGKRG